MLLAFSMKISISYDLRLHTGHKVTPRSISKVIQIRAMERPLSSGTFPVRLYLRKYLFLSLFPLAFVVKYAIHTTQNGCLLLSLLHSLKSCHLSLRQNIPQNLGIDLSQQDNNIPPGHEQDGNFG